MRQATDPSRRRALHRGGAMVALGGLLMLGGCGFALRRPAQLQLETVRLKGFTPRDTLTDEIRHAIEKRGSTRVVEDEAQATLEQLLLVRERVMAAQTSAGQVRELTLRLRFRFQVLMPGGRAAIAPTELALARDLSYDESLALAKAHEEEALFRAMQADIVNQVMRRLATVMPEPSRAA